MRQHEEWQEGVDMSQEINVVYHLYCINDGLSRFNKAYKLIATSGLLDRVKTIHVNCVGPDRHQYIEALNNYKKVYLHQSDYDKGELVTVNLAKRLAIKNPAGYTLYLHSKGAANKWVEHDQSELRRMCIESWIDFMLYHLVEKYGHCVKLLEHYDTCGCNMSSPDKPYWHYSGNFWWSRNSYLGKLPDCMEGDYLWSECLFLNGFETGGGKHHEVARSMYIWPEIQTNIIPPESYKETNN